MAVVAFVTSLGTVGAIAGVKLLYDYITEPKFEGDRIKIVLGYYTSESRELGALEDLKKNLEDFKSQSKVALSYSISTPLHLINVSWKIVYSDS